MRKILLRSSFVQRFFFSAAGTVLIGLPVHAAEMAPFQKATTLQISTPVYQSAPVQGQYSANNEMFDGILDSEGAALLPEASADTSGSAADQSDGANPNGGAKDPIANQFPEAGNVVIPQTQGYYFGDTPRGLLSPQAKHFGHLFFDGWVSAGGSTNNVWPMTYAAGERGVSSANSASSDFGMNQFYVSVGREMSKEGGVDFGLQTDILYGTDYLPVSSLGLESRDTRTIFDLPAQTVYQAQPRWNQNSQGGYPEYGLAMPQMYGEVYAPFMSGLTVKGGHFYSPLGYESFPSPSNFFYTHSYTMLYAEAQTVTGLLGELGLSDGVSILGGFSNGWDSWSNNNGSMDIMAGTKWQSWDKNTTLAFMLMSGDAVASYSIFDTQTSQISPVNKQQTNYSLVFQHKLAPNMRYVLQHDLGVIKDGAYRNENLNMSTYDGAWYSVINYLYLDLDPSLSLGFRAEWFKDYGYTRTLGTASSEIIGKRGYRWDGDNFVDLSLGLNWRPNNWLTIRPEVRWDYSDMHRTDAEGQEVTKGIYSNETADNMVTFGGDVMVRF